jgi:hypothetical protein
MECFNCGQQGHMAWQCSWQREVSAPLPKQFWRCARCSKIIYTWDKEIPCADHRTVGEWRAYYHSDQFVTDSAAARERPGGR